MGRKVEGFFADAVDKFEDFLREIRYFVHFRGQFRRSVRHRENRDTSSPRGPRHLLARAENPSRGLNAKKTTLTRPQGLKRHSREGDFCTLARAVELVDTLVNNSVFEENLTKRELKQALKKIKQRKAPGPDQIHGEMLKR